MYTGSVGVGGSAIGIGVVAGAVVTGQLPTTGVASLLYAFLAVLLILGGLLLLRVASLRRASQQLSAASATAARVAGLEAGLGLDEMDESEPLPTPVPGASRGTS